VVSGVDVLGYAQSAFLQANTVYNVANTLSPEDTFARTQANSAFITANTAFAWGNHATYGYATQTYVGTQISNLIDAAPTTLDTLNELAAALGDDANFATTTATTIGVSHNKANAAFDQANAAFTKANTGGASGLIYKASNTTPVTANVGDQWYSVTEDILYQYINDGTSNAWVDISSSAITTNAGGGGSASPSVIYGLSTVFGNGL
jgi:hypothetical protein